MTVAILRTITTGLRLAPVLRPKDRGQFKCQLSVEYNLYIHAPDGAFQVHAIHVCTCVLRVNTRGPGSM